MSNDASGIGDRGLTVKEQTALLALGVLGVGAILVLLSRSGEDSSGPSVARGMATWERSGIATERDSGDAEFIPAAPGGAAATGRTPELDAASVDLQIYGSVIARVAAIEPLREAFSDAQSSIDGLVHTSSDRNSIEHVITGKADLAIVTVELSANDREKGATAIQLGTYIPAIVINHDNPVRSITQHQVRELFNGMTSQWSSFRYAIGDIEVMQPVSKGLRTFYTELMLPGDSFVDGERYQDDDALYDALAADTKRIGITNLAHMDQDRCRALAIGNIMPSSYDFRMGMYPFGRTLNLVYRGMPSPELQEFIDFVRSPDGQEALAQSLYLR